MQPSSLVLVAIVGMWAAYLVPSWIRRGESHLARRQADRIAEDARVLEPRPAAEAEAEGPSTAPLLKRPSLPVVTASVPSPPSGAGADGDDVAAQGRSLAELMHDPHRAIGDDAQVRRVEAGAMEPEAGARILRRARAEQPPDSRSPEVAPARRPAVASRRPAAEWRSAPADDRRPVRSDERRAAGAAEAPVVERRPARAAEESAADRRPARPSPAPAVAASRGPSPASRAAARRARLLLLLVLATGASWAVVGFAPVPVLAAVPASVLLALDVLLILLTAPARARRRRAAATTRRPAAPAGLRRDDAPTAAQARRRTATVYDVDGVRVPEPVDAEPAPARVQQPDDGTWIPVPVPPPTYTMKPVVHRHEPLIIEPIETLPAAEAGVSLGSPSASPAASSASLAADGDDEVDAGDVTFDLDAVLARRRAVNG